mmetsp:Transcript_73488/g.239096  ORF Transcript_73488/g.239096 Transcript_73488/m.239096 type:complete len:226 (-) Transcript_73488:2226-2903(-)
MSMACSRRSISEAGGRSAGSSRQQSRISMEIDGVQLSGACGWRWSPEPEDSEPPTSSGEASPKSATISGSFLVETSMSKIPKAKTSVAAVQTGCCCCCNSGAIHNGEGTMPALRFCEKPKSATLARNLESTRTFLVLRPPCTTCGRVAWRKRKPWEMSRRMGNMTSPSKSIVSLRKSSCKEPWCINSMTNIGSILFGITAPMTARTQGWRSLESKRISSMKSNLN